MKHTIKKVEVNLVSHPNIPKVCDATRKVESFGFVIVRLTTDTGLEGFGITYHEVGGEAIRTLIRHDMADKLIGRDPLQNEVLWEEFFHYLRGVGRKGLSFCALSAVDIALWDLKGKILGLPLYRLLGGGSRKKIPVYASGGWTSYTDDELVEEMKGMAAEGYGTIKFKVGVEGGRKPARDLERVRKVRDAVGPGVDILLDANNCWDAATGAYFANRAKEYGVLFLEEPVFADDIPGLVKYKRSTDLPLATGEHEYTKFGARDLIMNGAVDILQLDGTRAGGYTEMLKIGAMTQAWNLKFAPHAMEHIHIHLASVFSNALFLERLMIFADLPSMVYVDPPMPKDGFMEVPDLPGLGLVLNEDFIREHDKKD